jgi:hypothetical protein
MRYVQTIVLEIDWWSYCKYLLIREENEWNEMGWEFVE